MSTTGPGSESDDGAELDDDDVLQALHAVHLTFF